MNLYRYLLAIALLLCISSFAQDLIILSQDPVWLTSFQSNSFIVGGAVTDSSGNTYTVSTFERIFTSDENPGLTPHYYTKRSSYGGANNYFLMKHNSDGKLLWMSSADGQSRASGIKIDRNGNVVVVGEILSFPFKLYSSNDQEITLEQPSENADRSLFIFRYSPDGELLQTKTYTKGTMETPTNLAIDEANNIYVVGHYFYSQDHELKRCFMFIKFDEQLNVKFDKRGKTVGRSSANAIAISKKGEIYLTGFFNQNLVVGNDSIYQAGTARNFFVGRYNADGQKVWLKTDFKNYNNGNSDHTGRCIAVDSKSRIFISGNTSSQLFLLRINKRGKMKWRLQHKSSPHATANQMVIGSNNEIFLVGDAWNSTVNSSDGKAYTINSRGQEDAMVLRYNGKGNLLSGIAVGGLFTDNAFSVGIYKNNLVLLGYALIGQTQFKETKLKNRYGSIWLASFKLKH